jgi:peptidoglycan/LPS O-acetylase OafA/YrhL
MTFIKNLLKDNPPLVQALDHVRWISAFLVVAGHVRNYTFLPYSKAGEIGLIGKAFYAVTNLHVESVIAFFVISGLLVGGKCVENIHQGSFDLKRYAINRLTRLYIVLGPAIFFGLALLFFQREFLSTTRYTCELPDMGTLIGNLLYMQMVFSAVVCYNDPLWSLANEFWYYVMMAIVTLGILSKASPGKVFLYAALFVFSLIFFTVFSYYGMFERGDIVLYIPMWAIGILAWFRFPFKISIFVSGPLLAGALILSRSHLIVEYFFLEHFLTAIGLTLFLISIRDIGAGKPEPSGLLKQTKAIGVSLAAFSYSLYLVHYPVLLFAKDMLINESGLAQPLDPANASSYLAFFGMFLSCVLGALFLYYLFERKTAKVRRWVSSRI